METPNQLAHSETRTQQHGREPEVRVYVLVIPKMEGPILETLQKLLSALSTREPVLLQLPLRKPALEIVDSWLEHSAAAEYLGVGRRSADGTLSETWFTLLVDDVHCTGRAAL